VGIANISNRHAFTLIELSIVLVVIALLIGGVLVGRDLIKAAEIRATISQIEKVNLAVTVFKGKYNCLPGDCGSAVSFGMDAGCDTACNDGIIDGNIQYTERYQEALGFWRNLSQANLVEAQYEGYPGYQIPLQVGVHYPAIKVDKKVGLFVSASAIGAGAMPMLPNQIWALIFEPDLGIYRGWSFSNRKLLDRF
jgi:prepilin-type N-terminal cleavage/methylation domain-containing protein